MWLSLPCPLQPQSAGWAEVSLHIASFSTANAAGVRRSLCCQATAEVLAAVGVATIVDSQDAIIQTAGSLTTAKCMAC